MAPKDTVAELLDELDAQQATLRELLTGKDDALLAERPPSGKWSVLENLRHMLFAEQAHLGGLVPGGRQWSPVGYTPQMMLVVKRMGTDGSAPSVASVLAGWGSVHAATRAALQNYGNNPRLGDHLGAHLRHQQQHVLTIERLLRAQAKRRPT